MNKKIKIDWGDWVTLLLFLCCVISLLAENLYVKWAFLMAETVIALISCIVELIITRKEEKEFKMKMEDFKNKIEGEFKDVDD